MSRAEGSAKAEAWRSGESLDGFGPAADVVGVMSYLLVWSNHDGVRADRYDSKRWSRVKEAAAKSSKQSSLDPFRHRMVY